MLSCDGHLIQIALVCSLPSSSLGTGDGSDSSNDSKTNTPTTPSNLPFHLSLPPFLPCPDTADLDRTPGGSRMILKTQSDEPASPRQLKRPPSLGPLSSNP